MIDAATLELLRPRPITQKYMPEGRRPTPKQSALLALRTRREILYGGQVGGGKSDGLLMDALQYVDVPGYSALIVRKRMTDLRKAGALIPRSRSWMDGTDASWNDNLKRWLFPSGATLEFGYIRNDDDVNQYQSAEYQFIGFDELTQFSKFQYTYMMSRLRGPNEGPLSYVPLRIRGATNPGGRGHEWAKARFVDCKPNDDPEDDTYETRHERAFISSGLTDNPHIDEVAYRRMLKELDPATRKQLEDGDWDAREPGNWVIEDPAYVTAAVDTCREWLEEGWIVEPENGRVAAGIDWGENTAAYCIWPLPNGVLYVPPSETLGKHEEPATVSVRILENVMKFGYPVSDWRYDAAGVQNMRTFMATARALPVVDPRTAFKHNSTKVPFSSFKRETMWYLRTLFRRVANDQTTRIILIHPDNVELIRQLKIWERKTEDTDDTVVSTKTTKVDDHSCDALVAGAAPIARANRVWLESLAPEGSDTKVVA